MILPCAFLQGAASAVPLPPIAKAIAAIGIQVFMDALPAGDGLECARIVGIAQWLGGEREAAVDSLCRQA